MHWYLMVAAVLVTCYILPKSFFYIKGVYDHINKQSSVDFNIPTKLLKKYYLRNFQIIIFAKLSLLYIK